MKILKALGSLRFAIALIAGLAVILAVSTAMESVHGTPFAHKYFYGTRWFDFFLSLLWVNIFCSTLTRWPFQKKHLGFIITHIGILTLLLGALLSRSLGVEGQMALFEDQEKNRIKKEDASENQESRQLTEGSAQDPENHAVRATLSGETMNVHQTFILIEHDPQNPHAFFTDIGPAHFEMKIEKPKNIEGPKILITQKSAGGAWPVDLAEPIPDQIPLGESGLTVTHARYFPNAKIKNNHIVNAPDQVHFNPAVEFEIHDATGRVEHHTRFYLFPNFDSLRGGRASNFFDLNVQLKTPPPPEKAEESPSPSFIFSASAMAGPSSGGKGKEAGWSYRILSKRNAPVTGDLPLNKKIPTGWMDMTVEAHQTFQRAVIKQPLKKSDTILPFKLRLLDFRKVVYPGTSNPSSFESDVILTDPSERITLEKTIKMNKPLDYRGWRIFQSSYMMDERLGEGSVFTIAKNPGIALIYGSAPVILLGVILLFYLHPFFNNKVDE